MTVGGQRGQTLVELLVGLAVTAIVLGAMTGLLYTVSDRATRWGDRVNQASNGFALASALQADGHRYTVPCTNGYVQQLRLSMPGTGAQVTYASIGNASDGWVVTRTEGSRTAASVGRLRSQPAFSVGGGAIHISEVVQTGDMLVYYRPQQGSCP